MRILIFILTLTIYSNAFSSNYIDDHVQKLSWNGIDVIWLEDSKLPTYDISIYFGEGAIGDTAGLEGSTEITLNQLTSGSTKYSQKEIIEQLEFYGVTYGSSVTHEFADFSVSGLVKDYKPTLELICHLFNEATFPTPELNVLKTRVLSSLRSIVTNHGALANHIFRAETLKSTGYGTSVEGNIASLKKVSSSDLKKRMEELNHKVKKRIYIKGPKSILGVEKIISKDCGWKGKGLKRKYPKVEKIVRNNSLIFIPMKDANQAQVRIGRIMTTKEVSEGNDELMAFASKFMGGGFTSRLIQGLRVERGLTYSASAYASGQSAYGRAGISTFTKNETLPELLSATKEIIKKASTDIDKSIFKRAKKNIKGNYLLGLESTSDFLKNLMFFDHKGIDYDQIYKFTEIIDGIGRSDLMEMNKQLFNWEDQTIVVLGDRSLISGLKKAGYKVLEVDYNNYL